MSTPVRILSVSDDDGLRFSRELLLVSDGYQTESITSNAVVSADRVRSFDIVLICRSVEPERAMALADMMRKYNPNIRILTISRLENRPERFDADLETASGPEPVLEACRKLCSELSARNEYFEATRGG